MSDSPFSSWAEAPDCVVICGGKGTRLNPRFDDLPKSMAPLAGRPLVDHVVEQWRPHVGRFLFVVNHLAKKLVDHLPSLGVEYQVIEETGEVRGIANALTLASPHLAGERFVMTLGDCLHQGIWSAPGDLEMGVGVWPTDNPKDISRSYSVELGDGRRITRMVEKPDHLPNDLCGTGFYFFDTRVFKHIAATPPSPRRGQVEITDVLQHIVDSGGVFSAVTLEGHYINVTYLDDLDRAEDWIG